MASQTQSEAAAKKEDTKQKIWPIFKIFGTILEIKQENIQEFEQSFEDVDSDDEGNGSSGSDDDPNMDQLERLRRKNEKEKREKERKLQQLDNPLVSKKNMRKPTRYWLDCRPYTHVAFIRRRLILRQQMQDAQTEMYKEHVKNYTKFFVTTQQLSKKEARAKLVKKARVNFLMSYA